MKADSQSTQGSHHKKVTLSVDLMERLREGVLSPFKMAFL